MTYLLLRKSLRESRVLLIGCAAAIFVFCWLRVWIVSRLSTDRFRAILDMLPSDLRRVFVFDIEWLTTYPGRISLAYQEMLVLASVSVWSIARGSDVVSGEVNRGTMEMLLAQPVSRSRILTTQSLVAVAGTAVLALSAWSGTCAGVYTTQVKEQVAPRLQLPVYLPGLGSELPLPFGPRQTRFVPMSDKVDVRVFLPASANLFALGAMMAGFTTLMSSWDRYRWRTIGIVTGILVAQLLLKVAGLAVERWHWLIYLSVLSAYEPEVHVRMASTTPDAYWTLFSADAQGNWTGFAPLAHDLLLLGVGTASYLAAALVFTRRDLPAPL
jgi:ABC-2 type transport system permease protein